MDSQFTTSVSVFLLNLQLFLLFCMYYKPRLIKMRAKGEWEAKQVNVSNKIRYKRL